MKANTTFGRISAIALMALITLMAGRLDGQTAKRRVSGKVTDSATALPVAGVRVYIGASGVDRTSSAVTDSSGVYFVGGAVIGKQSVTATRLGYRVARQTVTIDTTTEARVDFALAPAPISLEAIVVTDMSQAPRKPGGTVVVDTAGLRVVATAADAGRTLTATVHGARIDAAALLRGPAYAALYVIDGMTINTQRLRGDTSASAVQWLYSRNDINPEDIESITVLKGSSAVAIYGAPAAGGVIRVHTKGWVGAPGRVLSTAQRLRIPALLRDAIETPPACAAIPSLAEVSHGPLLYTDRYYSAKEATKVGIPIVHAQGNRDYLVIVRDLRRAKPCEATDGSATLHYGQVARAVIEVLSLDASSALNLASLAAEGTLNRRSQFFYLYKDGFDNPKYYNIVAEVSGKVFDVENYARYQAIMPQVMALFSDSATTFNVNLIDVAPRGDDPKWTDAAVITYAYGQLAKGRSCLEAQRKFETNVPAANLVRSTYLFITGSCDIAKPTVAQKERAKELLAGVTVK